MTKNENEFLTFHQNFQNEQLEIALTCKDEIHELEASKDGDFI